jgi:hypothetical protein
MIDTKAETEHEQQALDYERYASARNAACSLHSDQSKFIDQTILALGGGGLGITLTFMHDFVTIPVAPALLYVGDTLLLLSILFVLTSLYVSQKSISDHVDDLDTAARNDFGPVHTKFMKAPFVNASAKYTAHLNTAAMASVTIGMMFVALFVFQNLIRNEVPQVTKDTRPVPPSAVPLQRGLVISPPAVAPKPAPTQQAPSPQPAPKK